LAELFSDFSLETKQIVRKNHYVTYIKDGSVIVDALNLMGAHKALMNMENVRILKDMRNGVNRRVNCETANINKTVRTGVKQQEDIKLIIKLKGMNYLPQNLREIAQLRLEEPELPLKELGELLDPPLGKSGVNHRLKKISKIADELRRS
jgi:DNA-binding protein WhiA